jgi:hypothetical protein
VNVTFHDDAVAEYIAAVVWYERDYPGHGERFSAAIERALANLVRAPHAFAKRLGGPPVPLAAPEPFLYLAPRFGHCGELK